MPPHHASAIQGCDPTGVPSRRPRSVSITGVTGWWRAKPCSHDEFAFGLERIPDGIGVLVENAQPRR